jgi:hypothetical protein
VALSKVDTFDGDNPPMNSFSDRACMFWSFQEWFS